MKAIPPPPDPCLVNLVHVGGSMPLKIRESDWKLERKCPHGCGSVCKGLR